MGVTLGGADGHSGRGGYLLERETESVFEDEDARLGGRERRKAVTEVGPKLGELCLTIRCRAWSRERILFE